MFTIGEFAALGHVSARMLRHYDAIGLLVPADVDERTGYRRYAPAQLGQLLRIVQLRDLDCPLDDVAEVLHAPDEASALRRVLERRRTALVAAVAADTARLARLDEQLRTLEGEEEMTDIQYRSLDAVTVYAASGIAVGGESIPGVIDEILPALQQSLETAGVDYREPGTFWYEAVSGTDDLRVWVSWIAGPEPVAGDGWQVVELPAVERAAVTAYRGDMAGIGGAWTAFMHALHKAGDVFTAPCREVYLDVEPLPQSEWVTELQQPVG